MLQIKSLQCTIARASTLLNVFSIGCAKTCGQSQIIFGCFALPVSAIETEVVQGGTVINSVQQNGKPLKITNYVEKKGNE